MRLPVLRETEDALVAAAKAAMLELGFDPEVIPATLVVIPIRVCDICQDRSQEAFPVYTGEIDHLCMDCWATHYPTLCAMCNDDPCTCTPCPDCNGIGYTDLELSQPCASCESLGVADLSVTE